MEWDEWTLGTSSLRRMDLLPISRWLWLKRLVQGEMATLRYETGVFLEVYHPKNKVLMKWYYQITYTQKILALHKMPYSQRGREKRHSKLGQIRNIIMVMSILEINTPYLTYHKLYQEIDYNCLICQVVNVRLGLILKTIQM